MKNKLETFELENEYLKIKVTNIGASMMSFVEKQGGVDLILGYEKEEDYIKFKQYYMGAIIGRCANRIQNGQFELNDEKIQVSQNENNHSLHGGVHGISTKIFEGYQKENKLIFTLMDENMSNGYMGNLYLTVVYQLIENRCKVTFCGISDQDTIFNITHHPYFNLNGYGNIFDHELKIESSQVSLIDEQGLSKNDSIDVKDTAFDFMKFKKIGEQLNKSHENMKKANGFDHNYIFETVQSKKMATVQTNQLRLIISSDLPDLHLYSANSLNYPYDQYAGICLECQYYPNALHYPNRIQPILRAFQKQMHFIEYKVERRNEDGYSNDENDFK